MGFRKGRNILVHSRLNADIGNGIEFFSADKSSGTVDSFSGDKLSVVIELIYGREIKSSPQLSAVNDLAVDTVFLSQKGICFGDAAFFQQFTYTVGGDIFAVEGNIVGYLHLKSEFFPESGKVCRIAGSVFPEPEVSAAGNETCVQLINQNIFNEFLSGERFNVIEVLGENLNYAKFRKEFIFLGIGVDVINSPALFLPERAGAERKNRRNKAFFSHFNRQAYNCPMTQMNSVEKSQSHSGFFIVRQSVSPPYPRFFSTRSTPSERSALAVPMKAPSNP